MTYPNVSGAQLETAVRQLRRCYRQILSGLIETVESDAEERVAGLLPVSSRPSRLGNGRHTPEDEMVARLRVATVRGKYLLAGRWRVLSRDSNFDIDELTGSGPFRDQDPWDVVEWLASSVERGRELRGRGGRYGMIGNGLDAGIVGLLASGSDDPVASRLESYLSDGVEAAAKRLRDDIAEVMRAAGPSRRRESGRARLQALADAGASDDEYASLFEPEEQAVLSLIVGRKWCWRELAQHKLRLGAKPTPAISASSRKASRKMPALAAA